MVCNETLKKYSEYLNEVKGITGADDRVKFISNKFLGFNNSSVVNILIMCKIFYDLHADKDSFKRFLSNIRMRGDIESSQFRKYDVIGKNFDKLSKFAKYLPARWTTIYRIAKAPEDKLRELSEKGLLFPYANADVLVSMLFEKKTSNCNVIKGKWGDANKIQVNISRNISTKMMDELLNALNNFKNKGVIDYKLPIALITLDEEAELLAA